jgi:hypothetical protein
MDVIRNTADVHNFATKITADCCQISMHAGPNVAVEPWFAILGDVQDNLA